MVRGHPQKRIRRRTYSEEEQAQVELSRNQYFVHTRPYHLLQTQRAV